MGIFGGALLGVESAHASLARALTVTELARSSPSILIGEAVETSSHWERVGGRRRIVTYTRLLVQETLRDATGDQELMVQTLGGRVGKIGQNVAGEAALQVGSRSLLFLTPSAAGVARITGMAQGHYHLEATPSGGSLLRASRRLSKLQWVEEAAVKRLDGESLARSRTLVLEALK
jgi:hypothetical protein